MGHILVGRRPDDAQWRAAKDFDGYLRPAFLDPRDFYRDRHAVLLAVA